MPKGISTTITTWEDPMLISSSYSMNGTTCYLNYFLWYLKQIRISWRIHEIWSLSKLLENLFIVGALCSIEACQIHRLWRFQLFVWSIKYAFACTAYSSTAFIISLMGFTVLNVHSLGKLKFFWLLLSLWTLLGLRSLNHIQHVSLVLRWYGV